MWGGESFLKPTYWGRDSRNFNLWQFYKQLYCKIAPILIPITPLHLITPNITIIKKR